MSAATLPTLPPPPRRIRWRLWLLLTDGATWPFRNLLLGILFTATFTAWLLLELAWLLLGTTVPASLTIRNAGGTPPDITAQLRYHTPTATHTRPFDLSNARHVMPDAITPTPEGVTLPTPVPVHYLDLPGYHLARPLYPGTAPWTHALWPLLATLVAAAVTHYVTREIRHLLRKTRRLVRHGDLAEGRVIRIWDESTLDNDRFRIVRYYIEYEFTDPTGRTWSSTALAADEDAVEALIEGAPLPVLYHPQNPGDSLPYPTAPATSKP